MALTPCAQAYPRRVLEYLHVAVALLDSPHLQMVSHPQFRAVA